MAPKAKPTAKTLATSAPKKELDPPKADINDLIAQDAGAGTGTFQRQDLAIPRLTILQANSPQKTKSAPSYIKGAEEGDICDILNATRFSGDDGILVIPISYRRAFIEWKLRKDGG